MEDVPREAIEVGFRGDSKFQKGSFGKTRLIPISIEEDPDELMEFEEIVILLKPEILSLGGSGTVGQGGEPPRKAGASESAKPGDARSASDVA